MQKFIGLSIAGFCYYLMYYNSSDWRMPVLGIIAGIGGVIYGDAE